MQLDQLKKHFRPVASRPTGVAVHALDQLRLTLPTSDFRACVQALKSAAPRHVHRLFGLGCGQPRDLVYELPPLTNMSIQRELEWIPCWLSGQSERLNTFRQEQLRLQELVLLGEWTLAIAGLDSLIARFGWSLWAVELRCALLQFHEGTEAQKAWSAELEGQAKNRIPSLAFRIFSDRNDVTFSFDAFEAKCRKSLPRLQVVAPWLPSYLIVRALGNVTGSLDDVTVLLARDCTSSLIDYYEDAIRTFVAIAAQESAQSLQRRTVEILTSLLRDGFADHRMEKLAVYLDGKATSATPGVGVEMPGADKLAAVLLGEPDSPSDAPPDSPLAATVRLVEQSRSGEGDSTTSRVDLLKFGLNLNGLDVGRAVATVARDARTNHFSRVLPLSTALVSKSSRLEDLVTLHDSDGLSVLKDFANSCPDGWTRRSAAAIQEVLEGQRFHPTIETSAPCLLWMGRQLLSQNRFTEVEELAELVERRDPQWIIQAQRLRLWSLTRRHAVGDVFNYAAECLLLSEQSVSRLPMLALFANADWRELRTLDPVTVALVSHYVHVSTGDQSVGYICRMACRKFALGQEHENLAARLAAEQDPLRREILLAFLREVWIEENLALVHTLDSTDDVLRERMEILQVLLVADPDRKAAYVEAIKVLTLQLTIRQGLARLDQTRVFVNESAIARWAEKELLSDYERWEASASTATTTVLTDDILRRYVVEPEIEELLRQFTSGQPTARDALLIDLIDRLFGRFLLDPADGLDCYLSLRVRHGSLRGTVWGPLEERGLLYAATGAAREAFESRWGQSLRLSFAERDVVLSALEQFATRVRAIVDELVNERVQIRGKEKPRGAIPRHLLPVSARLIAAAFGGSPVSFWRFVFDSFTMFWKVIESGLLSLVAHIEEDVKPALEEEFNTVVATLRNVGPGTLPLVTALTAVATTTQSQCDVVAAWFQPPEESGEDKYDLPAAIEVAKAATKNVHRGFPGEVATLGMPDDEIPLKTTALAVLSDCLFVVFENAWKHSGLRERISPLRLSASFSTTTRFLSITVKSSLAPDVRGALLDGRLDLLRGRYSSEVPLELARQEGGSGFAKLARLVRAVDRTLCPSPLDFGVDADGWYTTVTIPLYERGGAYDAYE